MDAAPPGPDPLFMRGLRIAFMFNVVLLAIGVLVYRWLAG